MNNQNVQSRGLLDGEEDTFNFTDEDLDNRGVQRVKGRNDFKNESIMSPDSLNMMTEEIIIDDTYDEIEVKKDEEMKQIVKENEKKANRRVQFKENNDKENDLIEKETKTKDSIKLKSKPRNMKDITTNLKNYKSDNGDEHMLMADSFGSPTGTFEDITTARSNVSTTGLFRIEDNSEILKPKKKKKTSKKLRSKRYEADEPRGSPERKRKSKRKKEKLPEPEPEQQEEEQHEGKH